MRFRNVFFLNIFLSKVVWKYNRVFFCLVDCFFRFFFYRNYIRNSNK